MKTWILVLVLVGMSTDSAAQIRDINLSEYGMIMSACWGRYLVSLFRSANNLNQNRNGTSRNFNTIIKADFVNSCGAVLDTAIECHAELDRQAGFKLVDTKRLSTAIKSLCTSINSVEGIAKCADTSSFVTCLQTLNSEADICVLTQVFKSCVTSMAANCAAPLKDMLNEAVSTVILQRCISGQRPANKRCAGLASMTAVATCYVPFIYNMVIGGNAANTTFIRLCRDGVVRQAIQCHSRVQEECSVSYINTNELLTAANTACNHIEAFQKFGECLKPTSAVGFAVCINTIKIERENTLCRMTTEYRQCTNTAFQECNNNQKSIVRDFMALIMHKCDIDENSKCSYLEHGINMLLCWYPSLQVLIPFTQILAGKPSQYNFTEYALNFCSNLETKVESSLSCHTKNDEVCKLQWFRTKLMRNFFRAFCKAGSALSEMVSCILPSLPEYNRCAAKLGVLDLKDNKYICKLGDESRDCMNIMFKRCSARLQGAMNDLLLLSRPDECIPPSSSSLTIPPSSSSLTIPPSSRSLTIPPSSSSLTLPNIPMLVASVMLMIKDL